MTYNNMAIVLESQGKLEDAMELHRKALEIMKKTSGEDHSSVADTYNNMEELWEKIIRM
jgi:tetratricopeptide (TPR) repeat protein